jgi:hypothetical protein
MTPQKIRTHNLYIDTGGGSKIRSRPAIQTEKGRDRRARPTASFDHPVTNTSITRSSQDTRSIPEQPVSIPSGIFISKSTHTPPPYVPFTRPRPPPRPDRRQASSHCHSKTLSLSLVRARHKYAAGATIYINITQY